jgi:hypothetical protein
LKPPVFPKFVQSPLATAPEYLQCPVAKVRMRFAILCKKLYTSYRRLSIPFGHSPAQETSKGATFLQSLQGKFENEKCFSIREW